MFIIIIEELQNNQEVFGYKQGWIQSWIHWHNNGWIWSYVHRDGINNAGLYHWRVYNWGFIRRVSSQCFRFLNSKKPPCMYFLARESLDSTPEELRVGIMNEAFAVLKNTSDTNKKNFKPTLCSLLIGEIKLSQKYEKYNVSHQIICYINALKFQNFRENFLDIPKV